MEVAGGEFAGGSASRPYWIVGLWAGFLLGDGLRICLPTKYETKPVFDQQFFLNVIFAFSGCEAMRN